ncbi:hypothetical protein F5Y03DRAFT_376935 [Xylaria venustula]|nr:hypothetical protein F5Y03DRAFT_376935 [Xylaria venustula]
MAAWRHLAKSLTSLSFPPSCFLPLSMLPLHHLSDSVWTIGISTKRALFSCIIVATALIGLWHRFERTLC